jgi:hypothetical protein
MSRQVGSALGVAVLVVVLASPHPQALALYRRGWVLEIGAALALVVLRRPSRLQAGRR